MAGTYGRPSTNRSSGVDNTSNKAKTLGRAFKEKPCVSCGRTITWRKKWERDWDSVKYCSDACRSHGVKPVDTKLEKAILTLLAALPAGGTVSPDDAAKAVDPQGWKTLAEPARRAARRLTVAGKVTMIQGGHIVDPSIVKGPVLVRLV